MESIEITSIAELLKALEENNNEYNGTVWYRGHANSDWKLVPGHYRQRISASESSLKAKFKQNASMLIDTSPNSSFDWLFLMQHYGVPTRLLDWSENPLVALYFALEKGASEESNAALWCLRPCELNKAARINDPSEEFYIPSFEDEVLKNYSMEQLSQNTNLQLLPVATIATRNNVRIQAQLGVFTIHHHDKVAIENIGTGSHIIKYIIPGSYKKDLIKQLKLLGVTKFQLFPELSSIGDIMKEELL